MLQYLCSLALKWRVASSTRHQPKADRKRGRRQNLGKPCREGGETRSCGNAPDARSTYATAYDAYSEIAKIFNDKAEYEGCATWTIHVACLLVMFCHGRLAMPTVDVRM